MAIYRRKNRGKAAATFTARFSMNGKEHRKGGFPDREAAQDWIDTTRAAMRRGTLGYIRARSAQRVIPLIEEFVEHLETLKRSSKYTYNTDRRLRKIAEEAGWMTLNDVTAQSFEDWRKSRPKFKHHAIGPRTLNQYLDHANDFCGWLVKSLQYLPANPLAAVSHMTAKSNDGYRRAATLEELASLLAAAPTDRALVYRFLIYVPLRRRAIEGIEWRDLELSGERPTLTLRAELAKNGRPARLAIRDDLAKSLQEARREAKDTDAVFQSIPTTDELRIDLKAAGVEFDDGHGARRLDLHAFRKTAIRLLKRAGVPLDEAHVFLQHRDRRTTERHYDDDLVAPEISNAAAKMPEIPVGTQSGTQQHNELERQR